MSDGVAFKVTLDVSAQSESAVTDFAIAHLRERGYSVGAPNDNWETPGEFCRRVGIQPQNFRKRCFLHPGAPKIAVHRGPKGTVRQLLSNADFDAFCRRNKR